MTTPNGATPLSDLNNVQMDLVEDPRYDVATGYALLASSPRPSVLRGEDLDE